MGFLHRLLAMIVKEALQLRRDRLTFAMMFGIPIMQLVLFGFAINTDPKGLPTAILASEHSALSRGPDQRHRQHRLFQCHQRRGDREGGRRAAAARRCAVRHHHSGDFTRKLVRRERPRSSSRPMRPTLPPPAAPWRP